MNTRVIVDYLVHLLPGGYRYIAYMNTRVIIDYLVHLLQVAILQERLEEKDHEIERLKFELHEKRQIEEEKDDSDSNRKVSDDVIADETGN